VASRTSYAPTPTAFVIFLAGLAAGVVAAVTGTLLAHLILALVLALFVVAGALAARSLRGLTVAREVQATAYDGDDVTVSFVVRNGGRVGRSVVEISGAFYSPFAVSGRISALVAEVPAGGSASVSGEMRDLRRGEYLFPPPALSSSDPFGLFTATRQTEERSVPTARLTVFPRPFPIDYLAIASDLSWSISGLEPTNAAGTSGDFLGTREYRPGDSVRAIHWPLSARRGELVVKEFERNASTEVVIFVDLDAKAAWGKGRESTFEYAVRIAASAAEYAARRGNSVGLVAHASQWIVLPPGKGPYHQQMVNHYLAAFGPTGSTPFNFVIGQTAPQLKEGASAVIIFPSEHLHLEMFGPALEGLWARRIRVTAIIMNVESFLQEGAPSRPADMRAAAYLASRGADVYFVSRGADLSRQLSVPM
jgi:uncharacterized protein (DUF58 family)